MSKLAALQFEFQSWLEMFLMAVTETEAEFCRYNFIEAHKLYRAGMRRLEKTAHFAKNGKTLQGISAERIADAKAVPIEQVIQKYGGVTLDKYGRCCCPFHHSGNMTTLHKLPNGNRVCCFICTDTTTNKCKTWNPIDAVMELQNKTFREAVEELA